MSLIVFDLDGTLFDVAPLTTRALVEAVEAHDIPVPTEPEILEGIGRPGADWYRSLVTRHAGDDTAENVMQVFEARERALVGEAGRLFDGVADTLADVRHAGHVLAICSNGYPEYIDLVLRSTGIDSLFTATWSGARHAGGKRSGVRELLAATDAADGVVIGDRVHDIDAAHANGLLAVGAAYGYGAYGELAEADALVSAPREIPSVVAELLG